MSRAPSLAARSGAGPADDPGGEGFDALAPRRLHLAGLTVCVGMADFLAHSLLLNLHHFDAYRVVTVPEDRDTQRVARYFGARCVPTDGIRSRWGEFCKGVGINDGLADLEAAGGLTGWVLHHDCDVALPPVFRAYLEQADLDPAGIYGCDRAEFKSYRDWQRFIGDPQLHTGGQNCFVDVSHTGKRLGTRLQFGHAGGYVPLGFFQLWHPGGSGVPRYREGHTDAAREDNEFALRWPRAKRGFLPEVIAYHLESEDAPMAVNWKGRQTRPFRHE